MFYYEQLKVQEDLTKILEVYTKFIDLEFITKCIHLAWVVSWCYCYAYS